MKSVWIVPTPQAQEEALAVQEVKRRRRQRGFTLIEMLAVVIILAIVAGVGFVVVNNQIETARNNADIANVRTLADAAQRYMIDNPGTTKTSLDPATDLVPKYLGSVPKDPWNGSNGYTISIDPSSSQITVTSPHNTSHNITINY